MSTPTVTEVPRRMEPVARDTFIDDLRVEDSRRPAPAGARRAGVGRR
jgi:hypothetical protein